MEKKIETVIKNGKCYLEFKYKGNEYLQLEFDFIEKDKQLEFDFEEE